MCDHVHFLKISLCSLADSSPVPKLAKFRSKQRLPVVTWFDVRTGAHIARASQPSVGLVNSKRCLEDERLVRELAALTFREVLNEEGDVVWAPCTYYIVDARSKLAARGNAAMGKGTEQVKYYRDGRHATDLQFMNIDNIHKVRESCDELYGLGRPGALEGSASATGFSGRVDQTGWLHQVVLILKVRSMRKKRNHVDSIFDRCASFEKKINSSCERSHLF